MQLVIDIPDDVYEGITEQGDLDYLEVSYAINNGTPLQILKDGTLVVTVDDYTKIQRVLVQDKNKNGGLFYADSN